jgi:intein-encoded DNA endonuclease-like protein
LESLILKLRKKGLSWVNISKTLSDEFGYSISSMSVGRILKDIEWMKKEKRRMNRKVKSSPILNVV